MVTALSLLIYASVLGWVIDPVLARCRWVHSSPAAALLIWHATALGTVASVLFGLYLLAHDAAEHGFARLFHADKERLHLAYASAGEIPGYWNLALMGVAIIAGVLAAATTSRLRRVRDESAAHQLAVTRWHHVISRNGRRECFGISSSDVPAIYCVGAGRRGHRILVTSGAIDALDEQHLKAALDHESAHLQRRHHAMVLLAEVVAVLAQRVGMLRHYPQQVRLLVELDADDEAAQRNDRHVLAEALLQLSTPQSLAPNSHTLESTGSDPGFRIRRLIRRDAQSARRGSHCVARCLAVTVLALPVAASLGPALLLAGSAHAPQQSPTGAVPRIAHHS